MSIPWVSEEVRSLDNWAGDMTNVAWVGPHPRLTTLDGSTSYAAVEIVEDDFRRSSPSLTSGPVALSPDMRMSAQVRMLSEPYAAFTMILSVVATNFPSFTWSSERIYPVDGWVIVESPPIGELSTRYEAIAASAVTGGCVVGGWASYPSIAGSAYFDVSWIDLVGGARRPLRWRNRNDGLSGGPRQARGVSSQQMSNRHRGYL